MKILVLGNEFLKIDSLAKEIGKILSKNHDIIEIKDTFQLMTILQEIENPIILDVVKGLKNVRTISTSELKSQGILSAHDFDATYAIKLVNKLVKIIGIPLEGNVEEIVLEVNKLLEKDYVI